MSNSPGDSDNTGRKRPSAQPRLGETLRSARLSAGIDQSRIWTDVRISPEMLEALETGQYDQLPAPPYIKAFLGTLARYLNLDGTQLVDMYEEESGLRKKEQERAEKLAESTQDVSLLKPVMILPLILAAILLIWLFSQLGSFSDEKSNSGTEPALTDSIITDSAAFLNDSLNEDSLALIPDDSISDEQIAENPPIPRDTVERMQAPDAVKEEPEEMTRVRLTSVTDSVWIRVIRSGRPEYNRLLKRGQGVSLNHSDTIEVTSGVVRGIQVTVNGNTEVPQTKNFSVFGSKVIEE